MIGEINCYYSLANQYWINTHQQERMSEIKIARRSKPKSKLGKPAKKTKQTKPKQLLAVDPCQQFGFTTEALQRFETVRAAGVYNSLDPRVKRIARLSEDELISIITCPIYSRLVDACCK